jgi:predicted AlkP superfamily pyrophosphatase or phosphodiesterase
MKSNWIFITLAMMLPVMTIYQPTYPDLEEKPPVAQNVFIITIDGVRWQEVFTGADSSLLSSEEFSPAPEIMQSLFWHSTAVERRNKLMPFFWNLIGRKGQLMGNRYYGNCVNVANLYALSYPGYNEMLTGSTDMAISSNRKVINPNVNVLEYLALRPDFNNKVVAFTSWDVFPFILNTQRNKLPLYSGYDAIQEQSEKEKLVNTIQQKIVNKKTTRYDQLTYIAAREFIQQNRPRVVFLGLGETDEFAHDRRYDLYLQQINRVDAMIAELWNWVQTTPGYKDNTTFLITSDHGRGTKKRNWHSHGEFINGSSEAWLAVIGPGIAPKGELKDHKQYYLEQVARTISLILGENFKQGDAAPAISIQKDNDFAFQY